MSERRFSAFLHECERAPHHCAKQIQKDDGTTEPCGTKRICPHCGGIVCRHKLKTNGGSHFGDPTSGFFYCEKAMKKHLVHEGPGDTVMIEIDLTESPTSEGEEPTVWDRPLLPEEAASLAAVREEHPVHYEEE